MYKSQIFTREQLNTIKDHEIKYFQFTQLYNSNNTKVIHNIFERKTTYVIDDFDIITNIPSLLDSKSSMIHNVGKNRPDAICNITIRQFNMLQTPNTIKPTLYFDEDNLLRFHHIEEGSPNGSFILPISITEPLLYISIPYSESKILIDTKLYEDITFQIDCVMIFFPKKIRLKYLNMKNYYNFVETYDIAKDQTNVLILWYCYGTVITLQHTYQGHSKHPYLLLPELRLMDAKRLYFDY